jgi:sarcosine oxidase subunit gamma
MMTVKHSPLEGMSLGNTATVAIRELAGLHTLDIRVAPGTPSFDAVCGVLGLSLPGKTGQSASMSVNDGEAYAVCLAPDWWLLIGHAGAEKKLVDLRSEEGHHLSVVDVSGQRTAIELEGPHACDVLAHLWEQDLREKHFPVGAVSQGLLAKAPVIVMQAAPLRYRVTVRSSFTLHVWKILVDAATEWIQGVLPRISIR